MAARKVHLRKLISRLLALLFDGPPVVSIGLPALIRSSIKSQGLKEIDDAYSGHLRFDIGLLSRRLVIVTQEIANDTRSQNLGLGYFGASTGGAAALRAAVV